MNSRSCERVCGFAAILGGHLTMVSALSGGQWNEGDVSDSVVRRVALPDAFFALDGLFETFLTVLDEFGAFPAIIERENERYLPFLATTKVLMAAVRAGVGREAAHEAIKESAVVGGPAMRQGADNDLIERLAADPRLGLDRARHRRGHRQPARPGGPGAEPGERVRRPRRVARRPGPGGGRLPPRRHPLTGTSRAPAPGLVGSADG